MIKMEQNINTILLEILLLIIIIFQLKIMIPAKHVVLSKNFDYIASIGFFLLFFYCLVTIILIVLYLGELL